MIALWLEVGVVRDPFFMVVAVAVVDDEDEDEVEVPIVLESGLLKSTLAISP